MQTYYGGYFPERNSGQQETEEQDASLARDSSKNPQTAMEGVTSSQQHTAEGNNVSTGPSTQPPLAHATTQESALGAVGHESFQSRDDFDMSWEAFLDSLSTFLNDHIESIRVQGTGKVETTTTMEDDIPNGHIDHGDHGDSELKAMIAEAMAAQSALEPSGEEPNLHNESHELGELSAFLEENISKALEQSKSNTAELPSDIASATESASRATMLALQSIQQNQYQPTALPQSISSKSYNMQLWL